jgi:hypothetical protein
MEEIVQKAVLVPVVLQMVFLEILAFKDGIQWTSLCSFK